MSVFLHSHLLFLIKTQSFVLSFQDILENEDVKLDNMFIASLVGDIIRVSVCGVGLYDCESSIMKQSIA